MKLDQTIKSLRGIIKNNAPASQQDQANDALDAIRERIFQLKRRTRLESQGWSLVTMEIS